MKAPPLTTGERIRAARLDRGKTQVELAAAIGSTQEHLSTIETGRCQPTLDMLGRIARALRVEAGGLIGG